MGDQAEQLRSRLMRHYAQTEAKTIAIASGKGGVGKSNFTINFALKLIENGKKVLIFDLDIGMGNIDILLGVSPQYSFVDLFNDHLEINDIIELGPNSLSYIAGGSGLTDLFHLDESKFNYFRQQYEQLVVSYDYILFDMGAGVTSDSLNFITAANEAIIVTTPEPTSVTDAYAMIKHLVKKENGLPIYVLVNRSLSDTAGDQSFLRLQTVVEKFLDKKVKSLGTIPDDRSVMKAVNNQVPFTIEFPRSQASKALDKLVKHYLTSRDNIRGRSTDSFITKLKRFVLER